MIINFLIVIQGIIMNIQDIRLTKEQIERLNYLLEYDTIVKAIKEFREYSGLGLAESKQFIEVYYETRDVQLTKKILLKNVSDNNQDDLEESDFGAYLKANTRSRKQVELEKLQIKKKSEEIYTQQFINSVCRQIKLRALALARQGYRQLRGVLTSNGFVEYNDIDYLQLIKSNTDNDFGTRFWNDYSAVQYVKLLLEEKLDDLRLDHKVSIESQYHYRYDYKIVGGFFTNRRIKKKYWTGSREKYVILFEIVW